MKKILIKFELVPQLGTSSIYLCSRKQENRPVMKNVEYTLDTLGNVISSDSLQALLDMMDDLGLEVTEVSR